MTFHISIPPADREAGRVARDRIDNLTKPLGSLGRIEELAERLAAMSGAIPSHPYARRTIVVAAGDHGVTAERISAYPADVTPQMVGAFLGKFAAINAFARVARADVYVANFGVAQQLPDHPRLFNRPVAFGTRNFVREPAMSEEEMYAALRGGIDIVEELLARGPIDVLALGDMGIGN